MPNPTYTLIERITLASETNTFNFVSIPQSYYDLRLHISARSTGTGGTGMDLFFYVNGYTTQYRSVMVYNTSNTAGGGVANGLSGTGASGTESPWGGGVIPTSSAIASGFSNGMILIPGYTNTTNLARRSFGYDGTYPTSGTGMITQTLVGTQQMNPAAVNRVTLTVRNSNMVVGSSVSLYGCTNT